ncbi:MAG: serine/threonine-protein kinase [Nostocaceae cyanobacterium]|nr:serine/threonine-protein kinase [Nostocaceae cyanobacterium]
MVWATGQRLYGGRYVIETQLGGGGFGITYLARDKRGRFVVIKTLKDEVLTNTDLAVLREKYQQDFRDEALRLALCRHPHIVQIENAFHEGELPCIAMEYIEGENLWQRVRLRGALSLAEALHYIQQIADALTVIHEKGLLHRDVKPQNIMVRYGKSEAVLIDFGIAREFIPDITQRHTLAVSNGFAPIEQYAEQARRGEYTDVYALAATLYYLLTAKLPTPAYARAARVTLTPPQEINPSISDTVNQAILQGMAFAAEERPQSVQEWLELFDFDSIEPLPQPPQQFITNNQALELQTTTLSSNFPTTPLANSPDLRSAAGIDYTNLRDLLAAGKWLAADEETATIMIRVCDRDSDGWLDCEHIENFPPEDLQTINNLWLTYSNGYFGFSVQKRIYEECGQDYVSFGNRVHWRVDGHWLWWHDLTFNLYTFPGHLPSWRFCGSGGVWGCLITSGTSLLCREEL